MQPEEFRRHAHAIIDRIVDYWRDVESLPVLPSVQPGEIYDALPAHPPAEGEAFESVLGDVDDIVMPGLTHWQSPNFFGFFPANISGPAVLGELLSAGLGVQGMLWQTSPACTEVEMRVLDWLVEMLDLPDAFLSSSAGGGVIQDTASSATLCAILAARERLTGNGAPRVYGSTEAHSSLLKSVRIAGIGEANLRLLETDDRFGVRPESFARAIDEDRAAGHQPCCLCATVGTTSSHGMDPLRSLGELCRAHDVWMHVDAAHAGTAALCPEYRAMHDGLELADSYCFNPHKWMLTNFDCDCFYVRDRAALTRALSVTPEYLRNAASDSGAVFDYRDWHVPLGRRFRALKLWFVIRHYGVEGLRRHVRSGVEMARSFAARVEDDPHLELVVPATLNLVCFRHRGGDAATKALHESVNATGRLFVTHTRLHDHYTIRMAIGATLTQPRHVEEAYALIAEVARRHGGT